MTKSKRVSRRHALQMGRRRGTLPLVHIRTAGAAGKLAVGFWDHWVPAGNDVMQKQVNAWADKNKVEVIVDFITGNGSKLADRGRRGPGEDRPRRDTFFNWDVHNASDALASRWTT